LSFRFTPHFAFQSGAKAAKNAEIAENYSGNVLAFFATLALDTLDILQKNKQAWWQPQHGATRGTAGPIAAARPLTGRPPSPLLTQATRACVNGAIGVGRGCRAAG
jgi:hypothetical protein